MAKLIEVGEIGHLDFLIQIPRYTKTRTRVRASEREQTVTGVRLKKEIMHMPGQCQEVHMNPNQRPNRPNPPRGPFFPNSRADSPASPPPGPARGIFPPAWGWRGAQGHPNPPIPGSGGRGGDLAEAARSLPDLACSPAGEGEGDAPLSIEHVGITLGVTDETARDIDEDDAEAFHADPVQGAVEDDPPP